MIELTQRPHARNLVRWAKDRPRVVVFSADLTSSCEVNDFRDTYPDRFFSAGMAEQNMMGVAAGMAREGFRPWIHTFAVFETRRPLDQVAMSIAYPNLPVRLVGFLPGVTTPGGVTHQAIDDVGIMRLLPNMTILETGDATEVETILDVIEGINGPVYVRMLRGRVPRMFPLSEPFVLNQARVLSEGDDLTILTTGIETREALRLIPVLQDKGVSVQHLHISTLKPFSDPRVVEALTRAKRGVITLENHSVIGGLGSAVAELMAEHGVGVPLRRLGLQDVYAHGASAAYLMHEYGLDAAALLDAVEDLLGASLELDRDALRAIPWDAADDVTAEDL